MTFKTFEEMMEKMSKAQVLANVNDAILEREKRRQWGQNYREKVKVSVALYNRAKNDPELAQKLGLGNRVAV